MPDAKRAADPPGSAARDFELERTSRARVKRARGAGMDEGTRDGRGRVEGRRRKRLDERNTLAPAKRCTGGSLGIRRGRIRLAAGPGSAAECTVPFLDLFLLRPFTTACDRRATTGDLTPRGLLESTSHDVLTSLLRHGRHSVRDCA